MNMVNSIDIIEIAIKAGQKILEVYNSEIESQEIESKADNSPLTLADRLANEIICESLAKLYPAIPIISEEIQLPDYEQRKNWNLFWLVDPLDGTKEFVKRNGQFTVNIALIENGVPVLGVIQVPVSGEV
ncbi:MAG: 3'(2'),5'-bisphosphate nucleotidase CysQ, partial [Bacteroidetes bacterium]